MRLAIITTLRARSTASDWDHHVWLLQRTLDSLLALTDLEFSIIIVCHEVPDVPQLNHPRVQAITVNFAPPARINDEMCSDKALKLTAGIDWALREKPDYVMFIDADDLSSNRLGPFIRAHSGSDGWYGSVEYHYRYGGHWLWRRDLPASVSSAYIIVRANALCFAEGPVYTGRWFEMIAARGNEHYLQALRTRGPRVNTLAAVGHTDYVELLATENCLVKPLPFPANTVILHDDSTSSIPGGEGSRVDGHVRQHPEWRRKLSCCKQLIRRLPAMRYLTPELRAEFCIPVPETIPVAYREQGLPF